MPASKKILSDQARALARCLRAAAVALAPLLSAACSGAPAEAPATAAVGPVAGPPIVFSSDTLDGKTLSSETMAGRVTVIGLIATYDVASQAEVRFLSVLARRHTPRINVALLVLEAKDNQPLVEAFVASLGITCPVALADAGTIAGQGPFAGLHHVPSVIILDPRGREAWRHIGILQGAELEQAVRSVEQKQKGGETGRLSPFRLPAFL